MSKQTDRQNRTFYTYHIDGRTYIIRRSTTGFYTTFIKHGQAGHCMIGLVCTYQGGL